MNKGVGGNYSGKKGITADSDRTDIADRTREEAAAPPEEKASCGGRDSQPDPDGDSHHAGSSDLHIAGGTNLKEVEKLAAKIMNRKEFNDFYEIVKEQLGDLKPGNDKRIRLIGAVEGYAGNKYALTGRQLQQIFDLGFSDETHEQIRTEEETDG